MIVPLLDLKAQYAVIRDEMLAAVSEVLESQICVGGAKVAQLEKEIASVSDCRFAVGVSSGTDALLIEELLQLIGRDLQKLLNLVEGQEPVGHMGQPLRCTADQGSRKPCPPTRTFSNGIIGQSE